MLPNVLCWKSVANECCDVNCLNVLRPHCNFSVYEIIKYTLSLSLSLSIWVEIWKVPGSNLDMKAVFFSSNTFSYKRTKRTIACSDFLLVPFALMGVVLFFVFPVLTGNNYGKMTVARHASVRPSLPPSAAVSWRLSNMTLPNLVSTCFRLWAFIRWI